MTALWADLDAIRKRNVPGATSLMLTPGRRKSLAARMTEHGAADLRAMVEWVTGCRCGLKPCRACYLQSGGYATPDTYLRPDNCAKYVEATRERAPASTTTLTADWTEADACRAIVTRALMTGADIDPKDSHMRWMGRRVLKLMGGRDGWKHRTASPEWASQWRATWGTALADREAELRRIT